MGHLQKITEPLGAAQFLAHVWGQNFRHLEGSSERFSYLFGWTDLNEIIATHWLLESQIQILWGDRGVDHSMFMSSNSARGYRWKTLLPERINALLANGATLRLRQVDQIHRRVGELAAGLERELRDRVRVNVYVNCGPAERSAVHHDDHDVIVMQIDGAKQWRIYGPASLKPLPDDGDHAPLPTSDPPDEPVAELHLRKGDVLYLPRGVWHSAEAVDGPSLHLTVGIWRTTGVDLLEWIVDGLRESELLRADVPRSEESDQGRYLARVRETLVARLTEPDLLHRMFQERDAREPSDIGFALPTSAHRTTASALTPAHTIRLLARRAVLEPDGDHVVLRAGGHVFACDGRLTPVLEQLVVGGPLSVSALTARCGNAEDAAELHDLLSALIAKGLADIA